MTVQCWIVWTLLDISTHTLITSDKSAVNVKLGLWLGLPGVTHEITGHAWGSAGSPPVGSRFISGHLATLPVMHTICWHHPLYHLLHLLHLHYINWFYCISAMFFSAFHCSYNNCVMLVWLSLVHIFKGDLTFSWHWNQCFYVAAVPQWPLAMPRHLRFFVFFGQLIGVSEGEPWGG